MSRSIPLSRKATVLALATAAAALLPAAAFAKMDCHAEYDSAMTAVNGKQISAEHRDASFRIAHHAYDLCTIGREADAKTFFDKLRENGN